MSSSAGTWYPKPITITGTGTVVHGVQINGWNFADVSTSSVAGAAQTSGSSASTGSSTSGSAAANTTGQTVFTGSTGGLSSGAKAGIGIAVALGVIGICCMVATFMFFRRRRHAREKGPEHPATPPDYYSEAPAKQYGEPPKVPEKYAYSGQPPMQQAPVEIGHSRVAPVEIG